jgi:hypothetical protein
MPPVLLVVAVVYLWWQRHHTTPSLATSYRRTWFTVWFLLAFGPVLVWLFIRENQPDYYIWSLIAIQWVVGIWRGIVDLRNYRKRLTTK